MSPCAYVDNIVIFSQSLEEHLEHLDKVFSILSKYWVILSPKKLFLEYPSVQLLRQQVDALGLATSEDKLATITSLEFLRTLKTLETYLDFTSYLQQYISMYTQIVKSLQKQKTLLTCGVKAKGQAQQLETSRIHLQTPTNWELNTFHHLQSLFARLSILTYFNLDQQLFVDLDTSKIFGFDAVMYYQRPADHTKNQKPGDTTDNYKLIDSNSGKLKTPPSQIEIKLILSLSRLLIN